VALFERYECPNGHEVDGIITVPCEECDALVAYEPLAHGTELERQQQGAVDALNALLPWVDEQDHDWMTDPDIARRDMAIRKARDITLGGQ
jgi:hypothetical protein